MLSDWPPEVGRFQKWVLVFLQHGCLLTQGRMSIFDAILGQLCDAGWGVSVGISTIFFKEPAWLLFYRKKCRKSLLLQCEAEMTLLTVALHLQRVVELKIKERQCECVFELRPWWWAGSPLRCAVQ